MIAESDIERRRPGGQPRERARAMRAGSVRYMTWRPCKNGHLAERKTSTGKCLECLRLRERRRIEQQPGALQRRREASQRYKQRNTDRVKAAGAAYRASRRQSGVAYSSETREWKARYNRERRQRDLGFRLAAVLRASLYGRLKYVAKTNRTQRIANLGCSIAELKTHLERQFSGKMSWENWGALWQIDHIIPLASFDLTDPDVIATASHFTNLRPLLKAKNQSKKDRRELLL